MKGIFILLICAVAVSACKKKHSVETTFVAPEINIDSLEITPDTIEADDKESTPPATVDMLFADFIYLYSSNRSFQYSRTRFPLRHYKNRKPAAPIKKADWKFDRLYNKAELHIVVFDSEEALDEFDMSKSNRVVLEFLGFEKNSVRQYVFEKQSGKWELTQLNTFGMSLHYDSEFLEFYGHFANDSAFQRKHLDDYVDFVTYDESNEEEKIEGVIDVDQWYAFHPDMPYDNVLNLYYGQKLDNADVRVISVRGNSNSWSSMFKFKKKDGVWKLVKFVN